MGIFIGLENQDYSALLYTDGLRRKPIKSHKMDIEKGLKNNFFYHCFRYFLVYRNK